MRIIAFSDSHGLSSSVIKLIERTAPTTDLYIFCGDGQSDVERAMLRFPDIRVTRAKGNCDYSSGVPDVALAEAMGNRIVVTHGHLQGINYDTAGIERLARENKASLLIYGHTHCRDCRYRDGIYYVNPGSLALPRDGKPPSYAIIDIYDYGILISHADL